MSLQAWTEQIGRELSDLEHRQLRRTLRPHEGRHDFCSNDYLSLNSSGELFAIAQRVLERSEPFVGSTGSRLIRGHYESFERAEAAFASWTGFESALLFNGGYAANLGLFEALVHRNDVVLCDQYAHASLLDGIRLSGAKRISFRHNDLGDLSARLERMSGRKGRLWVVAETLYSMDGDSPDLPALVEVAERFGALLVLDEAHAVGVLGPHGSGLVAAAGLQSRVAAVIYPCGKGPGLLGAFVCGRAVLRDTLINRARSFVFSTALPPMLAEMLLVVVTAMPTYADRRSQLTRNVARLRAALAKLDLLAKGDAQIVPVILGGESNALGAAEKCRQASFDVRAIRPPSVPAGSSRLRITVHSDHTDEQLDALANVLGGG